MKSFGLITCGREDHEVPIMGSYIKRLIEKIKEFFISFQEDKLFENSLKKIELDIGLEILIIILPYSVEELETISNRKIKRINKYIHKVCLSNKLSHFILPDSIAKIRCFDNCVINPFKGDYLYKCLLADIVDDLYTKKGIKIWEKDITIIQGRSRKFLYSIIELLSPSVRFLTIISDDKETIEEEAGEAFLDSGLAVIITNDWKNTLRATNLILNLDEDKEYLAKSKLCNETTIINISKLNAQYIICSGPFVNGISARVPQNISEIIIKNQLNYFKDIEIAEIFILHAIDAENDVYGYINPDIDKMKIISKMFHKWGFKIGGFIGRHGVLKSEDIIPSKAV